jgi:hypothetical protein
MNVSFEPQKNLLLVPPLQNYEVFEEQRVILEKISFSTFFRNVKNVKKFNENKKEAFS